MDVFGSQRERVNDIERVLVSGAAEGDGVKSPSDDRIVQFHFVLAHGHPQLPALENWHEAREINGISVEDVPPLGADLGQVASLVRREEQEEVLEEPFVKEELLDVERWHEAPGRHRRLRMVLPQRLRRRLVGVRVGVLIGDDHARRSAQLAVLVEDVVVLMLALVPIRLLGSVN